jgi:chemotaxis methyl-accepting protein methylase
MTFCSPPNLCHVCFEGKQGPGGRVRNGGTVCEGKSRKIDAARQVGDLPRPPPTVAEPDCLARWIIARAGLDAGLYRHQPLERRLPACLRMLKAPSAAAARRLLERRPELLPAATSALLIGVTEFFRDAEVFDCVGGEVLPKLARRRGPLRVWSAACASGDELYSLAILLAEAGLLARSFLLGTDCRPEAIEQARAAVYPASALRALAPALREKYFEPMRRLPSPFGRGAGGEGRAAAWRSTERCFGRSPHPNPLPKGEGTEADLWRPIRTLRRQTHWKPSDVARKTEPGPWDMILWRNLAIYLNSAPAVAIWARLADALAPGGYLIVGKAEQPPAGLGLSAIYRCIYRRDEL